MKRKIFLILALVSAVFFLVGCADSESNIFINGTLNESEEDTETGRLVVTVTDEAVDMGSVSEIRMTIDEVRLYSESEGWVSVSSDERIFNLLELNAQQRADLFADENISANTYNQIELSIWEVIIVDDNGEYEATLPSDDMVFNMTTTIDGNQTTVLALDIIAAESLHMTVNGEYVFAPVVEAEAMRQAQIQIQSDNSTIVNSGEVESQARVGMDADGNVGVNVRIPAQSRINIERSIIGTPTVVYINIGSDNEVDTGNTSENTNIDTSTGVNTNTGGSSGTTTQTNGRLIVGITDAAANMEQVSEVNIVVEDIIASHETDGWLVLSNQTMEFNLLELQAEERIELITQNEVPEGDYNQLRMIITSINIVDQEGTHEARIPSNVLRFNSGFSVEGGQDTVIVLDFIVNESLHQTGQGIYVLAPVVDIKIREDANMGVLQDNTLEMNMQGFTVEERVGMDEEGIISVEGRIPIDAEIRVRPSGQVTVIG